jgi:hypothetical protein
MLCLEDGNLYLKNKRREYWMKSYRDGNEWEKLNSEQIQRLKKSNIISSSKLGSDLSFLLLKIFSDR